MSGPWPLVALVLAVPIVVWHGRTHGYFWVAILLRAATGAWIAALVTVAFFPFPLPPYDWVPSGQADYRGWPYPWISPVPFATIRSSIEQGWGYPAGKFLAGNLGAFVPLGLLAPLLSPRWRSWAGVLAVGLGASLAVEITQLALSLGMGFGWRVADVDDVILNTVGTLVGFGIWRIGRSLARRPRNTGSPS